MVFDRKSASVLILCSIPLHFSVYSDSMDKMLNGIKTNWKTEYSKNELYIANKITGYVGVISSITFIFIYYYFRKMRPIITILFFCSGITWLLYFGVKENTVYIFIILRALQGIYQAGLHISHFAYIMHFASQRRICFYGCLTQFSMFIGLFFENLLFSFVGWKTAAIIFFIESVIFGFLIWLVPEMNIKPKSVTNEHLNQKDNIRPIIIASISMTIQLLSGIGIMLNSLPLMLTGIGINIKQSFQSCVFNFIAALAVLIATFIIDSMGTKFMFCLSAFGLFVGLLIYGITLKIDSPNWVGALAVFIYFLFYGLGLGPIPWYLFTTMISNGCWIESTAIGTTLNLFLPTLFDQIWDNLEKAYGQLGSIIFCAIDCLIAILFGLGFLPQEHINYEDNINLI